MLDAQPKRFRVLVPKDCRAGIKISAGTMNIHITIIAGVSASRLALQPTLILPMKEFPPGCVELSNRFHWSGQETGWITEQLFCEWVLNVFIPHVQSMRASLWLAPDEPALLLLDGHSSRGSVRALSALREAGIVARTIPSHTSHVCQPLDRGVFRVFKKTIAERKRGIYSLNLPEKRLKLLELADVAWHNASHHSVIKEAWRVSGMFPLDMTVLLMQTGMIVESSSGTVRPHERSGVVISNRVITSDQVLLELNEKKVEKAARESGKRRRTGGENSRDGERTANSSIGQTFVFMANEDDQLE
jgi:hypothetical protein